MQQQKGEQLKQTLQTLEVKNLLLTVSRWSAIVLEGLMESGEIAALKVKRAQLVHRALEATVALKGPRDLRAR